MSFSRRQGLIQKKESQRNSMAKTLKNRLCNLLQRELYFDVEIDIIRAAEIINIILDNVGECFLDYPAKAKSGIKTIIEKIQNSDWFWAYDVFEYYYGAVFDVCRLGHHRLMGDPETEYKKVNDILIEENSAYRLDGYSAEFVAIDSEIEINEINEVLSNAPYDPVKKHINKALKLLSLKDTPDYENSIKESISAIESLVHILTENKASKFEEAIKKLKNNGIVIHGALEQAFIKLFGYTSDSNGIRHGGIDFKDAPYEDARFMLVTCSAFINYVLAKKVEIFEL